MKTKTNPYIVEYVGVVESEESVELIDRLDARGANSLEEVSALCFAHGVRANVWRRDLSLVGTVREDGTCHLR